MCVSGKTQEVYMCHLCKDARESLGGSAILSEMGQIQERGGLIEALHIYCGKTSSLT